MNDADLQFHYFKVHDNDNDDKLDGIELSNAMAHYHDEESGEKPEDYTEAVSGTSNKAAVIYYHRSFNICRFFRKLLTLLKNLIQCSNYLFRSDLPKFSD